MSTDPAHAAGVILLGTDSPLAAEYKAACDRAGLPSYIFDLDDVPARLLSATYLCPIFLPLERQKASAAAADAGFRLASALIDRSALVNPSATFGDGTFVNAGCIVGAHACVANEVLIDRNASIGERVTIEAFASVGAGAIICRGATIGAGAVIGAGATVLPSIHIRAHAEVADNSVLTPNDPQVENWPGPRSTRKAPDDPLVSVVIKAYNHAAYVAQCIESVLSQSFQDFEIVIVDDGSTDETASIIGSFQDPRIRFTRFEQNRGISAAMNFVVSRARASFIAILNSDDFALPGRLEAQTAYLHEHPTIAAVFSVPQQVDEVGRRAAAFEPFASPFLDVTVPRHAWLRHFFFYGNCLCAPTAMLRRSAFVETGMYDPRLSNLQDFDCWIRLLQKHEIHVTSKESTAFRVRDGMRNASAPRRDSVLRTAFESFQILKRYRHFEPGFLREIFAEDILRANVDASGPPLDWLAEIALLGNQAWHPLYAIDTLFEGACQDAHFLRLRALSGELDVFRLQVRGDGF